MDPRFAASAYRQASYDNAPPIKIVHMMYEGALRFLDQAVEADPKANHQVFNDRLTRAEAIVSELRLSLNHDDAPELSQNLNALYLFVESEIREAFLEREKKHIQHARDVLDTLLDGWKQVEVGAEEKAE